MLASFTFLIRSHAKEKYTRPTSFEPDYLYLTLIISGLEETSPALQERHDRGPFELVEIRKESFRVAFAGTVRMR